MQGMLGVEGNFGEVTSPILAGVPTFAFVSVSVGKGISNDLLNTSNALIKSKQRPMSDLQEAMRQRIKILVDQLEGGVQRRLALAAGVHATTIGEILGKRQNQPSVELLQKIAAAYPQLRTEWLLLGEGEMLKDSPTDDVGTEISQALKETKPKKPLGAGTVGISPELLRGDAQGPADQPGFSYGTAAKLKPAGLDLIERVEQHSTDIKQLQAALSKIQKQLNN